jgi:hypothetical protein
MISPHCPVFIAAVEGVFCLDWQMDSESRAFFEVGPKVGTPLPCPRPMIAQPIVVWTPVRIAGALFTSLVSVPRQLVPAALTRRRA